MNDSICTSTTTCVAYKHIKGCPAMGSNATRLMGRFGVWVVYIYDSAPVVQSLHNEDRAALLSLSDHFGSHIAFIPFDMDLTEGIEWYKTKLAQYFDEVRVLEEG